MKVEIQLNHYDLRIFIDDYPCVYIPRKKFNGFQAWNDDETMFVIEFYSEKTKIKTEWDTKEKWLQVLKSLNEGLR